MDNTNLNYNLNLEELKDKLTRMTLQKIYEELNFFQQQNEVDSTELLLKLKELNQLVNYVNSIQLNHISLPITHDNTDNTDNTEEKSSNSQHDSHIFNQRNAEVGYLSDDDI